MHGDYLIAVNSPELSRRKKTHVKEEKIKMETVSNGLKIKINSVSKENMLNG